MDLYAGTSGFSYDQWAGVFYPDKLPAGERLAYYATRLPTVEINNTFYRMPRKEVVEKWREAVGENFRFSIKASRRITHFKKLLDAEEEIGYLSSNLEALGDTLGAVLFQLPPWLRADEERLDKFLEALPDSLPACIEFRHDSWLNDKVRDKLAERNVPLVITDMDQSPDPDAISATADWGYLRLRREDYSDDDLAAWRARCEASGWKRVYAFFKHEDEGAGPKLAARFLALCREE